MPNNREIRAIQRKFKIDKASNHPQLFLGPHHRSSGPPSSLAFVNVEDPDEVKDRATQRIIRRHVMKKIGRARRKDTRIAEQTVTTAVGRRPRLQVLFDWSHVKICANFKRLFRAMDMVSEGLLYIAIEDSVRKSRRRASRDPRSLQSLSEIRQYASSLAHVRGSLAQGASSANRNAIIGSIICLAYFDLGTCNHEGWATHLRGLETIVRLYGGIDALESHEALRHSLFITDVLGALVYDIHPRFPQPRYLKSPMCETGSPTMCNTPRASSLVLKRSVLLASRLATLLNDTPRQDTERMGLEILLPVCNIAHEMLCLPRLEYAGNQGPIPPKCAPEAAAAELVRISSLALISSIISATSGDGLYCATYSRRHIKNLLLRAEAEGWRDRIKLKLWVLVIQALIETSQDRAFIIDQITDTMDNLFMRSWVDVMGCLYEVAWLDHVAICNTARLGADIESKLPSRTT